MKNGCLNKYNLFKYILKKMSGKRNDKKIICFFAKMNKKCNLKYRIYNKISMEIENGKRVIITNSIIVEYLSKNKDNEILIRSLENILLEFCRISQEFVDNYNKTERLKTTESNIIQYLQLFEKRQEELERNIEEKIIKTTEKMLENVNNKMNDMLITIDKIINLSLEKLNTDKLLKNINDLITELLEKKNDDIEKLIENKMRSEIIDPINVLNHRILENILNLPKELNNKEDIKEALIEINKRWDDSIINIFRDVKNMELKINELVSNNINKLNETNTTNENNKREILNQLNNIPSLSKTILNDILKDIETNTLNVKLVVNNLHSEMRENNNSIINIRAINEELKNKLDNLTNKTIKDNNSNKIKGSNGENEIYNLLSEKLMTRDGYITEQVNGLSHSCDILIKCKNKPDIRIESKAHGLNNGEKVRQKEVEKFERDLIHTNNHGIFVSLYSNIVGKTSIDLIQLSNGKFAIYLSNNNYNIENIIDSMNIIYKIDSIIQNSSNNDKFIISLETMTKLKSLINDNNTKINSVKLHLRDSINILNDLTLDMIDKLIINNELKIEKKEINKEILLCNWCNKKYKNISGLKNHQSTCKKSPELLSDK